MNIECGDDALTDLESAFRFNDAILRHMTIRRDEAVTGPSPLVKKDEKDERAPVARESNDDDETEEASEDAA